MVGTITLYTLNPLCPYAHRVGIALTEAKASYKSYQVNIDAKPDWYTSKVNPAGKVPALTYGGPDVPPDQPSSESVKLAESTILVEFVADLFPSSGILPSDPVQRAKARFFVDTVNNKLILAWYNLVMGKDASADTIYKGVEAVQALLPDGRKYALGDEFSIVDISVLPIFARMEVMLCNELGSYPEGEGKKVYETLMRKPRFEKFRTYYATLKDRESFKKTFNEKLFIENFAAHFRRSA